MKSWEWINRVGALVSIVGFVIAAAAPKLVDPFATGWLGSIIAHIAMDWELIAIGALILGLCVGALESLRRYRRQRNAWKAISSIYNQIHLQYKIMLSAVMTQKTHHDPHAQIEAEERMILHLRDFFENTLRQMAEVFTAYTGHECRTCFKYYDPVNKEVRAGHRCAKSQREREEHDQRELKHFNVKENTAFYNIIEDGDHAYFAANDLRELHRKALYKNFNKSWQQFYNSTVVVPICASTDPREVAGHSVYGFFCVDSSKACLDDKIVINMMKQVAMIYYLLFAHLNVTAFRSPVASAAAS
jgi:hypothetical protein